MINAMNEQLEFVPLPVFDINMLNARQLSCLCNSLSLEDATAIVAERQMGQVRNVHGCMTMADYFRGSHHVPLPTAPVCASCPSYRL